MRAKRRESRFVVRAPFPLIVHDIPEDVYADPRLLGPAISAALLSHFKQLLMNESRRKHMPLTSSDLALLASQSPDQLGVHILKVAGGEIAMTPAETERAFSLFDSLILAQAETVIAWRIVLSPHVLARFRMWERQRNGPDLFAQLGKALKNGTLVIQRRDGPRLDPTAERLSKEKAIPELDQMRGKLRAEFLTQPVTSGELLQWITKTAGESAAFPWLRYFGLTGPAPIYHAGNVKLLLTDKPPSSADLYKAWRARQTGYGEDYLSKKLSELFQQPNR